MLRLIFRALLRFFFHVEVKGATSAFNAQKLLVIANHESFLDAVLMAVFLPIQPTFVVHTSVLKKPLMRWIVNRVPHYAVDTTSPLAMKAIVKLIEAGQPVCIFPEGRLTVTGGLMKVYEGTAFVAARTGATIVPVRIDGAYRTLFSRLKGRYPRSMFPKITLTILPPESLPMPEAPSAKERRRKAGNAMRALMQKMLFTTRKPHTLYGAFLDAMETYGAKSPFIEDIRMQEETYQDVLRTTLAMRRLLAPLVRTTGTQPNIGVLMPNMSATVSLILAITSLNGRAAILNYTAGLQGMRDACDAACVRLVIASRKFVEQAKLGPVVEGLLSDPNRQVLYVEDLKEQFGLKDKLWLMGYAIRHPHEFNWGAEQNEAVILFTSGSEGKPKGVRHTHRSILANAAQLKSVADFSPADKFMMALPLFHSFGFNCGVFLPLITGARVFLYPTPLHYKVIPELVYDKNCTVFFATPSFLAKYGQVAHPYDFARVRIVVAGAEKLTADIRNLWQDKFRITVMEGYGVTECAPVIAVNTPMAYRPNTVGNFLPGIEHRLEPVPGIETGGLLHVKGDNVMAGYILGDGTYTRTESGMGPGWYATGDIVAVDSDGFISIKGRVKRFAKIAGEMVSLEVVEAIALAAAPGFMHACVAQADAVKGEALALYTTCPDLTRDRLLAAARELGSPELAVPRRILHLDSIPLLGTGKTDYVKLKQLAEAEVAEAA